MRERGFLYDTRKLFSKPENAYRGVAEALTKSRAPARDGHAGHRLKRVGT